MYMEELIKHVGGGVFLGGGLEWGGVRCLENCEIFSKYLWKRYVWHLWKAVLVSFYSSLYSTFWRPTAGTGLPWEWELQ